MNLKNEQYVWAFLRLSLGLTFFWAFIDKLLGLGFATKPENSWLAGGSPTTGFLKSATKGPFASFYQSLAGNVFVDYLFMIGLLLIGLSLILGIGVKIAGYSGAFLLLLMWTALIPPTNHPFLDDHIIYGIVMLGLTFVKSGNWLGFGKWWSKTKLVKKYKFLA
jgi:thiosulfate dehydrogenase (quinone) large subunit